jgi:hypothetical protein
MTEKKDFTRAIIPAQPGWYVATYAQGGTSPDTGEIWSERLVFTAIIAWETTGTGDTTGLIPLTYGYIDLSKLHALKRPDGMFELSDSHYAYTEDETLNELRAEHAAETRLEEMRRTVPSDSSPAESDTS